MPRCRRPTGSCTPSTSPEQGQLQRRRWTMDDLTTIGEALEAAAAFIVDKPADRGDAAPIQAAEMRATGSTATGSSGGIGTEAQAAATVNARMMYDEDKTTIAEIFEDTRGKLSVDKAVTRKGRMRNG
ncbi:hypothetical protein Ancab_022316 [Ancistrocladus abbreviatus]